MVSTLILGGCGGEGGVSDLVDALDNLKETDTTNETDTGNETDTTNETDTAQAVVLEGHVFDGPVANASIKVIDSAGNIVATASSDANAKYSLTVPATAVFPVRLEMTGGIDLVTQEPVTTTIKSLVTEQKSSTANISPLTTLVYEAAVAHSTDGSLKTVSKEDSAHATGVVLSGFGFGVDAQESDINPITTPIAAGNVASYVKANQAVAELVKRVAGKASDDQQKVFALLAEDILDGKKDGKNGAEELKSTLPEGTTAESLSAKVQLTTAAISVEVITHKLAVTLADNSRMTADETEQRLGSSLTGVANVDAVQAAEDLASLPVSDSFKDQTLEATDFTLALSDDTADSKTDNPLLVFKNALEDDSGNSDALKNQLDDLDLGTIANSITRVNTQVDSGEISVADVKTALDVVTNSPGVDTDVDSDVAGISVGTISGATTEFAGTATFTVVLDSEPTADVTIGVSSSDVGEGTVNTASLVFTSGNWNTPQTVTVTGVDDAVDDGDQAYSIVLAAATSSDSNYSGVNPDDVSVTNTDNDTKGITVSAISGTTTEAAGTATFTVVLTSEPTSDVTIGVSSSDTGEGTVSTASLVFTAGNWNTPQTVTVTGVNDDVDDGNQAYNIVLAAATSSDSNYNGVNPDDAAVTNTDNDAATLSINDISITEIDAGSATTTFTITSSVESVNTITVDYASSDDTATASSDYTATSGTATITAGNTSQTISVTHLGDVIDEANETFNITLSNATNATISDNTGVATINDNDAEPTVAFSAATSTHNESTSAGSITVSLSAVSGLDISVPFTLSGTAVADSQYSSISSSPLTISAGSSSAIVTFTSILDSNSSDETLIVTLGTPTYADLGATTAHTLTFNDQPSEYTNPQGQTFNRIAAGTFTMGSPGGEADRDSDETEHSVTLSQSFYMQTTEVTQAQWLDAGFTNPSQKNNGDNNYPVETINWWEALHYANWLSEQNGLTACYVITGCGAEAVGADRECTGVTYQNDSGAVSTPYLCEGYRLPTESEWEYAARAGTTTAYSFGTSIDGDYAWYGGNSGSTTHTVAGKTANPWGLYDMHGNVSEWVNDRYGSYPGTTIDPMGGTSNSSVTRRGGHWYQNSGDIRSGARGTGSPNSGSQFTGFRLLLRTP